MGCTAPKGRGLNAGSFSVAFFTPDTYTEASSILTNTLRAARPTVSLVGPSAMRGRYSRRDRRSAIRSAAHPAGVERLLGNGGLEVALRGGYSAAAVLLAVGPRLARRVVLAELGADAGRLRAVEGDRHVRKVPVRPIHAFVAVQPRPRRARQRDSKAQSHHLNRATNHRYKSVISQHSQIYSIHVIIIIIMPVSYY